MLWIVVSILGAVLLLIWVAVSAPLDLTFSIAMPRTLRPRVRGRWLYGLVTFEQGGERVTPRPKPDAAHAPEVTPQRDARPRRPRFHRARRGGRIAKGLLRIDGLVTETWQLIARLFHAIQWRRFAGSLRLGMDEPADTGELCGLVGPVMVFVPRSERFQFDFEPDFDGAAFDLEAQGSVRVIPGQVLGVLLRYVFSGPVLRGVRVVAWDSRADTR